MSTIAETTLAADEFALADTLNACPDVVVRVLGLVAHGGEGVMPYVRVHSDDDEDLRSVLEDDPTTARVTCVAALDEESLFRVDWDPRVRAALSLFVGEHGTVLDASASNGRWELRALFPHHDTVAATDTFYDECGLDVDVQRIDRLSESARHDQFTLTQRQLEALHSAYEAGYYEVPRSVNQADLAATFDVSHQALSERLRRAHETVVSNAVTHSTNRSDGGPAPSPLELDD